MRNNALHELTLIKLIVTVAQLIEALRTGGFDSRWCHWNFSWT
jgi:hypothetical protein